MFAQFFSSSPSSSLSAAVNREKSHHLSTLCRIQHTAADSLCVIFFEHQKRRLMMLEWWVWPDWKIYVFIVCLILKFSLSAYISHAAHTIECQTHTRHCSGGGKLSIVVAHSHTAKKKGKFSRGKTHRKSCESMFFRLRTGCSLSSTKREQSINTCRKTGKHNVSLIFLLTAAMCMFYEIITIC